jgi:hypothetical protein
MNTSTLALRLDEFARENPSLADLRQAPLLKIVAASVADHAKPRRLTLTSRRILARDAGLRQFRVY